MAKVAHMEHLDKESGLNSLDHFLKSHSYLNGVTPSKSDAAAFLTIGKHSGEVIIRHHNVARWFFHIGHFHVDTRQKWGDGGVGVVQQAKLTGAAIPAAVAPAHGHGHDHNHAGHGAHAHPHPPAVAATATAGPSEDLDLFGEETVEEKAAAEAKKAAAAAAAPPKKEGKKVIAKSNVIFDVKPNDSDTDMKLLEAFVRSIQMDGLVWGAGKLLEVAYGVKKLQIGCAIEDEKVSTDDLEERLMGNEELVQSVDIVAFNKI